MILFALYSAALLCLAVSDEENEIDDENNYANYKVLRVWSDSAAASATLHDMIDTDAVEVITRGADRSVDVLVPPESAGDVINRLDQSGANLNILHWNVDNFLDEVGNLMACNLGREKRGSRYNFSRFFRCYHEVDDQHTFLKELASANPDKAETFSIGKSHYNRDLLAIRISSNVKNSRNKPMIWIDGNIHGREWISSTTALWIAGTLLGEVDTLNLEHLLDSYQFVILPMSNPDGYNHSRRSRFTRFWRKTRRPNQCSGFVSFFGLCKGCRGVDPNRNFDAAFGTAGVKSSPCAESYPGTEPFSEKNTQAMRDFILENRDKLKLYLSYHSYSQIFLKPMGYRPTFYPDSSVHDRAGEAYTRALRATHGYEYESMRSMELYPNSGSSADWVYLQGVTNSYTVELRDKGEHMFFLPKSQIQPCGEENVRGLVALVEQLSY